MTTATATDPAIITAAVHNAAIRKELMPAAPHRQRHAARRHRRHHQVATPARRRRRDEEAGQPDLRPLTGSPHTRG